jgi:hypothetical protein
MPKDNALIEDKFIEEIEKGTINKVACDIAGMGETTLYNWLDPNHSSYKAKFSKRYNEARRKWKKTSAQRCVSAMQRRAEGFAYEEVHKKLNPNTGQLEVVETKTKYIHSDTAAIFLTTNHDRDNYQQRNVIDKNVRKEVNIANFDVKLSKEEEEGYKKRMDNFIKGAE